MNEIPANLKRWQSMAFGGGVAFLLLTGVGVFTKPHATCISYLFAYIFWVVLALGCLLVVMLHSLARGDWGIVTRRIFEAGSLTLPVLAVLFVPLCFGLHELYPWANADMVASNPVLRQKAVYNNLPAFLLRAIIFFAITIWIMLRLRHWSLRQDATAETSPTARMRFVSGPGIVIIPFVATFVLIDWTMSIESAWYSTIFPIILLAGGVLGALALAVLLLAWFSPHAPFDEVVLTKHFHDLGNLLLAFVMFWTYVAFSQWLITYSGDQPHEIGWYLSRTTGGWKWLILIVIVFYFFVPFFVLLSRSAKQNSRILARVAGLVLVMNVLEIFWTVMPTFYPTGVHVHWTNITAWLGIGGIWLGVFARSLAGHPLLIRQFPITRSLEPVPHEK